MLSFLICLISCIDYNEFPFPPLPFPSIVFFVILLLPLPSLFFLLFLLLLLLPPSSFRCRPILKLTRSSYLILPRFLSLPPHPIPSPPHRSSPFQPFLDSLLLYPPTTHTNTFRPPSRLVYLTLPHPFRPVPHPQTLHRPRGRGPSCG